MLVDYYCDNDHVIEIDREPGDQEVVICECGKPMSRYFGNQATPSVWKVSKPT